MSEEKRGIKELEEVIVAVNKLSVDIIKALKDGLDISDIKVITENLEIIKTAVKGIDEIDDELKNLDSQDIASLMTLTATLIFDIIVALKKE